VVQDAGDGWDEPELERYVARWTRRRLIVERQGEGGTSEPSYPVRVRGLKEG
jgi:alpha-glucosidase